MLIYEVYWMYCNILWLRVLVSMLVWLLLRKMMCCFCGLLLLVILFYIELYGFICFLVVECGNSLRKILRLLKFGSIFLMLIIDIRVFGRVRYIWLLFLDLMIIKDLVLVSMKLLFEMVILVCRNFLCKCRWVVLVSFGGFFEMFLGVGWL